ncbi:MAG TPA: hypothetical protein DD733_10505, partial [Clostridiales bacterium]|nr:hypothetical protein [Clostridiales bacterium]
FVEARYERFMLSELEEIKVEQLISTGRVTALRDNEPVLIFNFSSTYKHDAGLFCRAAESLKKDGKIDEEKLKDSDYEKNSCPKCGRR